MSTATANFIPTVGVSCIVTTPGSRYQGQTFVCDRVDTTRRNGHFYHLTNKCWYPANELRGVGPEVTPSQEAPQGKPVAELFPLGTTLYVVNPDSDFFGQAFVLRKYRNDSLTGHIYSLTNKRRYRPDEVSLNPPAPVSDAPATDVVDNAPANDCCNDDSCGATLEVIQTVYHKSSLVSELKDLIIRVCDGISAALKA